MKKQKKIQLTVEAADEVREGNKSKKDYVTSRNLNG